MMKTKLELLLSYTVFAIALVYGVMMFIQLGYKFTPTQMSYPGMVIVFLITCTFNSMKIRENLTNKNIHLASVFANLLAFLYALAFSIFDPWVGKVITTLFMGIILVLSTVNMVALKKD